VVQGLDMRFLGRKQQKKNNAGVHVGSGVEEKQIG
jgi:hypothetical protein